MHILKTKKISRLGKKENLVSEYAIKLQLTKFMEKYYKKNTINIPTKWRNKIKVLGNTIIEYYNVGDRKKRNQID